MTLAALVISSPLARERHFGRVAEGCFVNRLTFHFHQFFMRMLWFADLAKVLRVFPGGFGTLDERFEVRTLSQTRKMRYKSRYRAVRHPVLG